MTVPARVDLSAYKGDTWSQSFRLLRDTTPVDLSGATVAAWYTTTPGVDPHHDFVVTIIDAADGRFALSLPATNGTPGRFQYDVEVTEADGTVTTWIRGVFQLAQDVTNAVAA